MHFYSSRLLPRRLPAWFLTLGLLIALGLLLPRGSYAQYASEYTGGLKVSLNQDGTKYIRFITWHQMWSTTNLSNSANPDFKPSTDFLLRRSRFLAFAQINKRFLILTHFGLNSLGPDQMGAASPRSANGGNGPFFMHDAWVEYTVVPKKLYIGGGLHYWNGISRLTNQSTLNFMTLDAPLHNWATIGTTDQFARHLGFYAKGHLGKLEYRLSLNEALTFPNRGANLSDLRVFSADSVPQLTGYVTNRAVYRNPEQPGGGKVFAGYLNYQFLDQESNVLPYYVGTYLGTKKVFNLGAGFFYHTDGASYYESAALTATPTIVSPFSFAVDAFYDAPLGEKLALSGYASFTHHDWGPNWTGGLGGAGTGNILYAQAGLALPEISEKAGRFQPYLHFTHRDLELTRDFDRKSNTLGVGLNWYEAGHNSKLTLEYQREQSAAAMGDPGVRSHLRLQMVVFL